MSSSELDEKPSNLIFYSHAEYLSLHQSKRSNDLLFTDSVSSPAQDEKLLPASFAYPSTAGSLGHPPPTSPHQVFSNFLYSPLPSGAWRTTGLSDPSCCLPTSFSARLVFFILSLCLARWFWPDQMNGRPVHTTSVCVSLRWSGGRRVVRLPSGS